MSELRVLVPYINMSDPNEQTKHTERLLLHTCYLSMNDSIEDYLGYWQELSQDGRLPPVIRNGRVVAPTALGTQADDERAETARFLLLVSQRAAEIGRGTYKGVHDLIGELAASPDEADAAREALVIWGSKIIGRNVLKDICDNVAEVMKAPKSAGPQPQVRDLLREELHRLALTEFGQIVCTIHVGVLHGLTGLVTHNDVEQIGQRMWEVRNAVHDMSIEDVVQKILEPFRAKYKRYPSVAGRGADDHLDEFVHFPFTVDQLDRMLKRSGWKLNLSKLVTLHRYGHVFGPKGPSGKLKGDALLKAIRPHARKFNQVYCDYDDTPALELALLDQHGVLRGLPGEHAVGLIFAGRNGWRGFAPGTQIDALM